MTDKQKSFYVDFVTGLREVTGDNLKDDDELLESIKKGCSSYQRVLKKQENIFDLFPGVKNEQTQTEQ